MEMFLKATAKHCVPSKQIQLQNSDKVVVAYKSFRCSFGVFPVSIKIEDFLEFAESEETKGEAKKIRKAIVRHPEGKLFFSAERFDYTKGIKVCTSVCFLILLTCKLLTNTAHFRKTWRPSMYILSNTPIVLAKTFSLKLLS